MDGGVITEVESGKEVGNGLTGERPKEWGKHQIGLFYFVGVFYPSIMLPRIAFY